MVRLISAPVAFDGSDRSPRPASSSTRPDSVSSSRPVPTRPWLHRRPGPSLMGAATPMTSLRTSLFPMGLDVQGTPMGIPSRKEKTSNIQTFLRVRPGKTSSTLQENNPFLDPPSFLPPHLDIVSEQDIQLSMSPFEKQSGQASSMTGVKKPRQSAPKEQFRFSSIIPPDASHRDMYRKAALPLVKDLLEKNSGSGVLFAYGITNSGKTHALQGGIISTGMEGGKNARGIVQEPGIIPMTLETIFHSLHGHLSPLPHRPLRRTEVEPCPVSSLGTSRVSRLRSRGSRRRTGRRCSLTPADLASLNARSTPASKGNLGTMPPLKEKAFSIWEVPVDGSYEYAVWMSYAEIRGKRVCDLLSPTVTRRRPGGGSGLLALSLRTDKDDQCYIHGLREIQAMSLDEAMAIFRQGRENRTAYSTLLNKDSSRSHAILSIKVLRKKKIKTEAAIAEKEDDERGVSLSQLSFVDLAGAETHEDRLHRPGPAPREVGGINRSLMVFGMCLEAMRSVRNRGDFRKADYIVPFRESQLTHLFQGVFTGRDRASMLVCLNPWDSHQRDMAKVLRFASVAEQPTVPVVEISLGDGPPKNWGRTESPYSMGSNPSASLGILSEEEECEEENAPNCNMHSSASEDEPSSMGGSQENELDINKDDQDSSHGPWFAPTHSTRKRTRRTRKRKRPSPPEEVEEINERNRDEYVKSLVAQNQDLREKWLVSEARLVTLEAEVRDQVVREMEGKMQEMEKRILGAQPMFDRNSSEEDDEGDEDEDEDEDEGGVEDEECSEEHVIEDESEDDYQPSPPPVSRRRGGRREREGHDQTSEVEMLRKELEKCKHSFLEERERLEQELSQTRAALLTTHLTNKTSEPLALRPGNSTGPRRSQKSDGPPKISFSSVGPASQKDTRAHSTTSRWGREGLLDGVGPLHSYPNSSQKPSSTSGSSLAGYGSNLDPFDGHSPIHRTMHEFKELKKSGISPLRLAKVTTERIIGRRKWARKRSREWQYRREEEGGNDQVEEPDDIDREEVPPLIVGGKRKLRCKRSIVTDEDLASPPDPVGLGSSMGKRIKALLP